MAKTYLLLLLSGLMGLTMLSSERVQPENEKASNFDQLNDYLVADILLLLPTADLFKIRLVSKRMRELAEGAFADRLEELSDVDFYKVKHFAVSKFLEDSIKSEMERIRGGKKQNEEFKKLVKDNGTHLDLSGRNIDYLYLGAFDGLANLNRLSLTNNQLKQLKPGIFKGLVNLRKLWLSSNQLNQLQQDVFNGLDNLQVLWLGNTQLKHLDLGTFIGLVNLRSLDLGNNQLMQLKSGIFDGLVKMEELDLSDNQLNQIEPRVFNALANLRRLDLYHNQLKQLEPGIFNGLANLKKLYLGYDQLTNENIELLKTALLGVDVIC